MPGGGVGGGGAGCPSPLRCQDVSGSRDFACLDPATSSGIPANAAVCANTAPCMTGFTCYLTGMSSNAGVCLRDCGSGAGGGASGGGNTGGGIGGGGGGLTPVAPEFVSASTPVSIDGMTGLTLTAPQPGQPGDFLIAIINAAEESGPRTVTAPTGWAQVGGWPIHNVNSQHTPYIIPASQNHGMWLFSHRAAAGDPPDVPFAFNTATIARGVVISYRGVSTTNPINDKAGYGLYGDGNTNGFGSGNTTLNVARQVNIVVTALTSFASYTTVFASPGRTQRVNTGENPNGLNLIVHDDDIYPRLYTGPGVRHFRSPSATMMSLQYGIATLLLTPQ